MLMLEHGFQQQEEVENILKNSDGVEIDNLKEYHELPIITLSTLK